MKEGNRYALLPVLLATVAIILSLSEPVLAVATGREGMALRWSPSST
jgi:hypothetical protein